MKHSDTVPCARQAATSIPAVPEQRSALGMPWRGSSLEAAQVSTLTIANTPLTNGFMQRHDDALKDEPADYQKSRNLILFQVHSFWSADTRSLPFHLMLNRVHVQPQLSQLSWVSHSACEGHEAQAARPRPGPDPAAPWVPYPTKASDPDATWSHVTFVSKMMFNMLLLVINYAFQGCTA